MISRRKLFGMLGVAPIAAAMPALPVPEPVLQKWIRLYGDPALMNFRIKELHALRSNNRAPPIWMFPSSITPTTTAAQ